jgi:single stranded DNA-binding protein
MNKFLIEGRLGKDAEVRESNGSKFLSLTVAENQFVDKEKKTFWYDVICFNYNEKLVQYYKRGSILFITGTLTTDVETGKDNVTRCRRKIVADALDFLSGGKSDNNDTTTQSDQQPANTKKEKAAEPIRTTAVPTDTDNSDLPF